MEYDQLPEKVRETVPSPDEEPDVWEVGRLDPTNISTATCAVCDDELFHLPHEDGSCWHCGAEACFVNDYGEQVHGEYVEDAGALYIGYNLALEEFDPDEDDEEDRPGSIMCGYCEERFGEGNTVTIVAPDGETFSAAYDGNVVRDNSPYGEGKHTSLDEAPGEVWDILKELVLGGSYVSTDAWRGYHTGPDAAGDLTKVAGGWHSSLERSDFSERLNELTRGDFHRDTAEYQRVASDELLEAALGGDDPDVETVEEERDGPTLDVPVAVMFGRTSNVMSIGIDVYAPEDAHDEVKTLLDETAQPGYAGVS